MKIFLMEAEYGHMSLAEVEVEEKDKSYRVVSSVNLRGWMWAGKLIKKDSEKVFLNLKDAIIQGRKDLAEYVTARNEEIATAQKEIDEIDEVFPELKLNA